VESLKVDYDAIAQHYNRRYEARQLAGVRKALDRLRTSGRVLEVGCGTGHWLRSDDFGVDLSFEMLRRARGRLACANASALPFRSREFSFVFCVNAIHHFGDKRAFICEARRVLQPGGTLAVLGISPEMQRGQWWIYEYFDRTYDLDQKRFPRWGEVTDWCLEEGFRELEWRVVETIIADRKGSDIFLDPFLPKHAASQLALLTDEEYEAGLARIEAAISADPKVLFRSRLLVGMLVAR
jgi:SAM-dependent methyltransferase